DQLEKKGEQYNEQKRLVAELKGTLDKELDIYRDFVQLNPNTAISAFIKYYSGHEENSNPLELTSYLEGAAAASSGYLSALNVEKAELERERTRLLNELNIAQARLNSLRRNVKTYPRNVQQLIEAINTDLSAYYKKEVRVRPLCELIEVKDESWRNALEGYLSTQRFDLIIDPLYFNDALEVYDRVKNEFGIYGVGLVNTAKIGEYNKHQDNSLASKIQTDHPYAKSYANMILGHTICVENLSDLKNYSRSITKTAMTYSNYTARQINPRIYDVPYIGHSATSMQVTLDEKLIDEQEKGLSKIQALIDKNNQMLRLLQQSKLANILGQ